MPSKLDSPPIQPGEHPNVVVRPRRRSWVAVGAVLVLLGAAVSFLANYDPLCHSDCTGVGGVRGTTVAALGEFTSPQGTRFSAYRVQHAPGKDFSCWFTLSNSGPVGVTITRVGAEYGSSGPIRIERVQIDPTPGTGDGPLTTFRPFSLNPDEFIDVLVTIRMQGCLREGASTTLGSVLVSFRVLGVPRATTVYLPEVMEVKGGNDPGCS